MKLSYRNESLRICEHLMYALHVLIYGDNGISRDLLDVCFGDQLAGSMNWVGTRFRLDSPVETLGHSLKFFVLVE